MRALSDEGADFLVRHEGFVSRAYSCPAGVLTIGSGFTMRSKTARAYWIETRGRKLRRGDTITRAENAKLLKMAVNEYGKPADRAMPGAKQHEYEAGLSYTFNCGPGAAKDKWFRLFQAGAKRDAAARLKTSRCTARGKPLRGLRIRRGHEAKLLLHADYGRGGRKAHRKTKAAARKPVHELMEYQTKLLALGYEPGPADGWMGPRTASAVLAFQKKHPDLKDDGVLGKATIIAIDRAIKARQAGKDAAKTGAGAAVIVGGGAVVQQVQGGVSPFVLYAIGGVLIAAVVYAAWKFWPEIEHKIGDVIDG